MKNWEDTSHQRKRMSNLLLLNVSQKSFYFSFHFFGFSGHRDAAEEEGTSSEGEIHSLLFTWCAFSHLQKIDESLTNSD